MDKCTDCSAGDNMHAHADETTHTHTHSDGTTHSHLYAPAASYEEAVALLRYMLSHNSHHAEELHGLSHCFEDEIADLLHDAVDRMQESNGFLEQALSLIDN